MAIDTNYEKSMEQWFASMQLNIDHTTNDIQFHEKEIDLHHKQLKVCLEQLKWDVERLAQAKEEYAKYLEINK